jgi:hypothetical protein
MQVVRCPKCNSKLNLPPAKPIIRCPRCNSKFNAPASDEPAPPPPPRVKSIASRLSAPLPSLEVRATATNCGLCGLRLTSIHTCPDCEESFCSQVCLSRHLRTCTSSANGADEEEPISSKRRPVGIAVALLLFATAGLIFFAMRGPSASTAEEATENAPPNMKLTASDLWRRVNLGEKLDGKLLQVTGTVESVEASASSPSIQLTAPDQSIWSIRCVLNPDAKQSAAQLRLGQSASVAGTYAGRAMGSNVVLVNCRLVDAPAKR